MSSFAEEFVEKEVKDYIRRHLPGLKFDRIQHDLHDIPSAEKMPESFFVKLLDKKGRKIVDVYVAVRFFIDFDFMSNDKWIACEVEHVEAITPSEDC